MTTKHSADSRPRAIGYLKSDYELFLNRQRDILEQEQVKDQHDPSGFKSETAD